jgi:hypothetical protein
MRGVAEFALIRRLTASVAVAAIVAACAGPEPRPEPPPARSPAADLRAGFACCNLHHEGDRITDANLGQFPFVPAGTPVRVRAIDGYRADILVAGKPMQLVLEQGRSPEAMQSWVERLVVTDDPQSRLERFPAAARAAIRAGQVMKGMSREQVIMALGPPQGGEDKRADAPSWRYWWSSFGPFYVYWNKGGAVSRIDGHPDAVARMVFKGK